MPAPQYISVEKFSRLVGRPDAPSIIDVCTEEDFAAMPRLIPGAVRRPWAEVSTWAGTLAASDRPIVVVCQKGLKLSQGVAAYVSFTETPAAPVTQDTVVLHGRLGYLTPEAFSESLLKGGGSPD